MAAPPLVHVGVSSVLAAAACCSHPHSSCLHLQPVYHKPLSHSCCDVIRRHAQLMTHLSARAVPLAVPGSAHLNSMMPLLGAERAHVPRGVSVHVHCTLHQAMCHKVRKGLRICATHGAGDVSTCSQDVPVPSRCTASQLEHTCRLHNGTVQPATWCHVHLSEPKLTTRLTCALFVW